MLSQISTPLTREQATALADAAMERDDLALAASAYEDQTTGEWVFEATTDSAPDVAAFESLAREVLGGDVSFSVAPIDPDVNWIAKSLEGLKPVIAGGIFVHGTHDSASPPGGLIPIRIDAAQAFGTGHHETTTGCLEAIDMLLKRRRPRAMIDIGTGTGVLAIALAKRTHLAVVATDIDPIATRTAGANARDNGVGTLVRPLTANGPHHQIVASRAPYDLIVANILAGPLVSMSPSIGRIADRGAAVVLSGLLSSQASRVITAYARWGLVLRKRLQRGDWMTLILERMA